MIKECGVHSAPTDKESKRIDVLGKKIFSSATLGMRIANYQAVMAHYHYHLWNKPTSFINNLLDDQRKLANAILMEGQNVAKHEHRTAFDASDTSARAIALGMSL